MILAFSCGETGVPFHLFNRKINQMSRGWSSRGTEILHTLAESGFIFTFAASGMQYHYIVPADLRLLLQEIFAKDMSATLRHPKETPINRFAMTVLHWSGILLPSSALPPNMEYGRHNKAASTSTHRNVFSNVSKYQMTHQKSTIGLIRQWKIRIV